MTHLYSLLFEGEQKLVQITEASLSRVLGRYWSTGFIIVSANRSAEAELGHPPSPEEELAQSKSNQENDKRIRGMIRSAGFGFVPTWGGYRETIVDPETGESKLSDTSNPEPSYIVPAMAIGTDKEMPDTTALKELGMELCTVFNQDSFLYKPSAIEDDHAHYVGRDGEVQMTFDGVTPNDFLQTYYTQLRKKPGRFTLTEHYLAAAPKDVAEARRRYGERFWRIA